jgi:MFS family permease
VFFGLLIPVSAMLADRYGSRAVLLLATALIAAFGLYFAPMFSAGTTVGVLIFFIVGFSLMGFTYGPLGTTLAESFPVLVRYTGASLSFNMAGIFGASLAPYIATSLASGYGLAYVGYYLTAAAVLTFLALIAIRLPRHPAD